MGTYRQAANFILGYLAEKKVASYGELLKLSQLYGVSRGHLSDTLRYLLHLGHITVLVYRGGRSKKVDAVTTEEIKDDLNILSAILQNEEVKETTFRTYLKEVCSVAKILPGQVNKEIEKQEIVLEKDQWLQKIKEDVEFRKRRSLPRGKKVAGVVLTKQGKHFVQWWKSETAKVCSEYISKKINEIDLYKRLKFLNSENAHQYFLNQVIDTKAIGQSKTELEKKVNAILNTQEHKRKQEVRKYD